MRANPSGNLFASVNRLLATTLELLGIRLALLGTELELAKRRLLASLLWGGVGLILTGVGVLLACGFILMLCWEQYRLLAIATLALLFLAIGLASMRHAMRQLNGPSGIFALSLQELARDGAMLGAEKPHEPP